jgi:hypothetical protein
MPDASIIAGGGACFGELQVKAAKDVDHVLGKAFHHIGNGFARGFGIAGYLLPGPCAEEDEEVAGRECSGAGGIGWNCYDERRRQRWICSGSWKRCGCHVIEVLLLELVLIISLRDCSPFTISTSLWGCGGAIAATY